MKQAPYQATVTNPHQHRGVTPLRRSLSVQPAWSAGKASATSTTAPRQQHRRNREAAELALLIHAGWVGMALIVVACIPVWKADFDKRHQADTLKNAKPATPLPHVDIDRTAGDHTTLFAGGSNSLVARAVGHAEGTRTPDGRKTHAYYGHQDPGNGAWNLGSFSFQHCRESRYACSTPEQADDRQLHRLQQQDTVLQQRAEIARLQMTLEEELNGIDLANQAPLAALSDQAYVDRLLHARRKGLSGQDAILSARVWSFWNPQTNRWDAPGLGNTEPSIRHDQERRLLAIARAITVYQQQLAGLPASQRSINWFKLQPEIVNPYSFDRQRSPYLWWDAGYWDAKLNHQRQLPRGYDPAYDAGFSKGSNSY